MSNARSSKMRKKNSRDSLISERLEKSFSNALNIAGNQERRLTRGMLRKCNQQEITDSTDKKSPSRNNVIIINDTDNENSSFTECSSKQPSPLQKSSKKSKYTSTRTNRFIKSGDSSVIHSSSTQELDGENIAPLQNEDDIIELWSNVGNCSKADESKKVTDYNTTNDAMKEELMFVIDTTPDWKNLEYLEYTDTKHRRKKRKYQDVYKTSPDDEPATYRKLKHSNKSQERRQHNNVYSNSTESGEKSKYNKTNHKLREIIVDGCNVAMAYTNNTSFSEKGIKLIVDYFKQKGHIVKVFLPQHVRRRRYIILEQLYKESIVVFTPSRFIAGKFITPYDDRYILEYATACGGIVISSDQYRDLYREKPEWRDTILNRLLAPTFVGDYVMFPEDPLGMSGPDLDTFLRH